MGEKKLENIVVAINSLKEERDLLDYCTNSKIHTYKREKMQYPIFFFFAGNEMNKGLYYDNDISIIMQIMHEKEKTQVVNVSCLLSKECI